MRWTTSLLLASSVALAGTCYGQEDGDGELPACVSGPILAQGPDQLCVDGGFDSSQCSDDDEAIVQGMVAEYCGGGGGGDPLENGGLPACVSGPILAQGEDQLCVDGEFANPSPDVAFAIAEALGSLTIYF